jgi:hypothetical protein
LGGNTKKIEQLITLFYRKNQLLKNNSVLDEIIWLAGIKQGLAMV